MKLSKLVLSAVLCATLLAEVSWAQVASTEALFDKPVTLSSKEKVMQFAERKDVAVTMAEMGVEPQVLKERVASMTEEEASTFAGKIDTMPAGADAVGALVGAAVFVFIVLLITDLLGFTKVFNFTRKITN